MREDKERKRDADLPNTAFKTKIRLRRSSEAERGDRLRRHTRKEVGTTIE